MARLENHVTDGTQTVLEQAALLSAEWATA
jgi:hypothetical protein